jgi:hypothetical protein
MNERRTTVHEIEADTDNTVIIVPNEHLHAPDYEIKSVPEAQKKALPSYQINKVMKASRTSKKPEPKQKATPAVAQYLSHARPVPRPRSESGLVKRLWQLISGAHNSASPTKADSLKISPAPASLSKSTKDNSTERGKTDTGARPQSRRGNRGGSSQRNRPNRPGSSPAEKSQGQRAKSSAIQAVPAVRPTPKAGSGVKTNHVPPASDTKNPAVDSAATQVSPDISLPLGNPAPTPSTHLPAASLLEREVTVTQSEKKSAVQQTASPKPSELQQVKTVRKKPDSTDS